MPSHEELLETLGVGRDARDRLGRYLSLLSLWNQRTNLTAAETPEQRVDLLIKPVLAVASLIEGPSLIDVGSGNGSPGMVAALLCPGLQVTLLEPRLRRWAFLREVARKLARGDIQLLRQRHDEYRGPAAQTLSLRALRLELGELLPLLRPRGRLLVLGRNPDPDPGFAREGAPAPAGVHLFRRLG